MKYAHEYLNILNLTIWIVQESFYTTVKVEPTFADILVPI